MNGERTISLYAHYNIFSLANKRITLNVSSPSVQSIFIRTRYDLYQEWPSIFYLHCIILAFAWSIDHRRFAANSKMSANINDRTRTIFIRILNLETANAQRCQIYDGKFLFIIMVIVSIYIRFIIFPCLWNANLLLYSIHQAGTTEKSALTQTQLWKANILTTVSFRYDGTINAIGLILTEDMCLRC